ncbi:hypothetical protein MASR2M117_26370 [Paludibacter sp.]
MEELLDNFLSHLLTVSVTDYFSFVSIEEKSHGLELRMEEKSVLVSSVLKGKSVVSNGYCNPLELLHFSMKGKPLYLKLYRRRWKESGSTQHFSNQYDLHPSGVKATYEFAAFLKGEARCTADEYVRFLLGT